MSEEAPVNIGAVEWPDPGSAYFMVRRMQTKLHRWAGEDPSRRFGDLHNLVCDPAFLVHAWERVSTNKGAKTAGIDKATAAMIENWVGVGAFLGQIRDSLKSGEFRPAEVPHVSELGIMQCFALQPWAAETGSGFRGAVRRTGWGFGWFWSRRAGWKVHGTGGVPPVVTGAAWFVRDRELRRLPGSCWWGTTVAAACACVKLLF